MKLSKERIVLVVVAVLLVIAVVYICTVKYNESKNAREFGIFQQGAQYAVTQIMGQAATCQQVPLYYNNGTLNYTVNLIAVECLQQASAAGNASK